MTTKFPYIITVDGLAITIDGIPHFVTDARYDQVIDLIRGEDDNDDQIRKLMSIKEQVEELAKGTGFEIRGSTVFYKNERLPAALETRVLSYVKEQLPLDSFGLFMDNVRQNPSKIVFERLWGFLEHGKMPMTSDGCFLAYKRVKTNDKGELVDCYTGKIINNPGTILEMERRLVDDNMERTCSYGYHVCSHEYLAHFPGTHTVTCKVNPRDVVAIPPDYNNTKMRVCKYEVLEILPDNVKSTPILSQKLVMDSYSGDVAAKTDAVHSITLRLDDTYDEFETTVSLTGSLTTRDVQLIATTIEYYMQGLDAADFSAENALREIQGVISLGTANIKALSVGLSELQEYVDDCVMWDVQMDDIVDVAVRSSNAATATAAAAPSASGATRVAGTTSTNRWGIVEGAWSNNVWKPAAMNGNEPVVIEALCTRDQAKRRVSELFRQNYKIRHRVYDRQNKRYV